MEVDNGCGDFLDKFARALSNDLPHHGSFIAVLDAMPQNDRSGCVLRLIDMGVSGKKIPNEWHPVRDELQCHYDQCRVMQALYPEDQEIRQWARNREEFLATL
jgi:hypothetical protein